MYWSWNSEEGTFSYGGEFDVSFWTDIPLYGYLHLENSNQQIHLYCTDYIWLEEMSYIGKDLK